jgi:hypothetical protein
LQSLNTYTVIFRELRNIIGCSWAGVSFMYHFVTSNDVNLKENFTNFSNTEFFAVLIQHSVFLQILVDGVLAP